MTKNMTEGNPAKLILFFAIPLFIGNLFQQLYNMADAFIVGRTLGVTALAAVGCTGSLYFLIIGFTMGIGNGLAIITSRNFGAGDQEGVKKSFAVSIVIALMVSVVMTVLAVTLSKPLLHLLQTPSDILEQAHQYIVVIYAGIPITVLYNLLSGMIRGLGDSRTPLYFLIATCLMNIGLDYLLILTFGLGVAGAALATIISQFFSGILCVLFIVRRFPALHIGRRHFHFTKELILEHVRMGFPMGFQMSIISIGAIILQAFLNQLGSLAVAANTAAMKIDSIAIMPLHSFGATIATYVAQNRGAAKVDRIKKGIFQCSMMCVVFSLAMFIVMLFFSEPMSLFFVGAEPEVAEMSALFLKINAALYWELALLLMFRNSLQGLGHSMVPTIAGIMELFMRATAAFVFSKLWGFTGICLANPMAWFGALIPLTISFILSMKHLERDLKPLS